MPRLLYKYHHTTLFLAFLDYSTFEGEQLTLVSADHVQITALARALHVNVSVAYLDGHSPTGNVEFVPFQHGDADSEEATLHLLYRYVISSSRLMWILMDVRPGHYDILETTTEE
jgi:ubiquitin thioesterase protein OTUB1